MSGRQLSRRAFGARVAFGAAAAFALPRSVRAAEAKVLRMGGPVPANDPDSWVKELARRGYRAAFCPVGANASDDVLKAYAKAAAAADIVIAEVGAWSNPISPDAKQRGDALALCKTQLALAERIGARCCVNISGSRGPVWDGPSKDNLTQETFDLIVVTTRGIIDEVKPTRTFFTLETMPWAYPDSPESYLRLIKAVDRKAFAVHFDPVNFISSPQRYYGSGALIREAFEKLGPYMKSCHAKDIKLDTRLTTHLDEIRAGLGGLDYAVFLQELTRFPEVPLMLEHLPNDQEYALAAEHIRGVGKTIGVGFGKE
jgi:sugar phosphate isomerase/epimerase